LPDSSSNEDPNANYTGWELPEHPGLRAWIASLPPLYNEALYLVYFFTSEGEKSTYHLVTPITEEQAFEEFDAMFLAAHNGVYGSDVELMSLFSPEVGFQRKKLAGYKIQQSG
jgi:hypothetical protein